MVVDRRMSQVRTVSRDFREIPVPSPHSPRRRSRSTRYGARRLGAERVTQTDEWGRTYLDGSEEGPSDLVCLRCGMVPFRNGNPFGTTLFEFSRGDTPGHLGCFALCGPCAIAFWEWATPTLTLEPRYIAQKDQHAAAIPDFVALWNSRAPEWEQI